LSGSSAATFAHVSSSTTKRSRSTMMNTPPTRNLKHSLGRAGIHNCQRTLDELHGYAKRLPIAFKSGNPQDFH
jgi:hypothetical protein